LLRILVNLVEFIIKRLYKMIFTAFAYLTKHIPEVIVCAKAGRVGSMTMGFRDDAHLFDKINRIPRAGSKIRL
jgi:hypothetical protein